MVVEVNEGCQYKCHLNLHSALHFNTCENVYKANVNSLNLGEKSMKSASDLFRPGEEMLLENFDVGEQSIASNRFLLQDASPEANLVTFNSCNFSPLFSL
jgi:hypothetical protein